MFQFALLCLFFLLGKNLETLFFYCKPEEFSSSSKVGGGGGICYLFTRYLKMIREIDE